MQANIQFGSLLARDARQRGESRLLRALDNIGRRGVAPSIAKHGIGGNPHNPWASTEGITAETVGKMLEQDEYKKHT